MTARTSDEEGVASRRAIDDTKEMQMSNRATGTPLTPRRGRTDHHNAASARTTSRAANRTSSNGAAGTRSRSRTGGGQMNTGTSGALMTGAAALADSGLVREPAVPASQIRFPDGTHFRIEIPSVEGPAVLRAVVAEAA